MRLALLAAYVLVLIASWAVEFARPATPSSTPHPEPRGRERARGAPRTDVELAGGLRVSALRWGDGGGRGWPVILLHGAPGQAADFSPLAELLTDVPCREPVPRTVHAVDLLGFGGSRPTRAAITDYSILANARAVLAWMDRAGIGRAHVVGWSQGGGVVLHMADLAPERIGSVTLMASIGAQETEGSRSYAFEHARYALGDALRWTLPRIVPDFGFLDIPPAATRTFSDSDQRPLRDIMRRIGQRGTPALVLHGERDFLVPPWAAEEHARLIPGARLIMTPWSHFVPFWSLPQREQAADWLGEFWTAAERGGGVGGAGGLGASAPPPPSSGWRSVARRLIALPWWVVAGLIALASARRGPGSRWTVALSAALVVAAVVDYGVVLVGLVAGAWVWLAVRACAGPCSRSAAWSAEWRERLQRGAVWAGALAVLRPDLRTEVGCIVGRSAGLGRRRWLVAAAAMVALAAQRGLALVVAIIVCALVFRDPSHPWGVAGVVMGVIAARVGVAVVDHLLTIPGRRALHSALSRARRFEFWPVWLVYLLIAPTFVRGTLRSRHPLAFTACNPAIENGGGVVGESKHGIMRRLASGARAANLAMPLQRAICRSWLIDESAGPPAARADRVAAIVDDPANGLAWPVILKPDRGYRGFSVRRIASRDEARAYFEMMPRSAIVQPLHGGPGEVGVVWVRGMGIFSITLKEFPFVEGDGRSTLEELIWRHPRLRMQAEVFLARLAGRGARLTVPARGERLAVAGAGNHCQGTLFRDGGQLKTVELARTIDAIAGAFAADDRAPDAGGGLDMVRMDIRYRDEADLRAGRLDADAIVEMNGTLGESTNIYDPGKPLSWSLGVLGEQWAALYELGSRRMRAGGGRPMGVAAFAGMIVRNARGRRGSTLAD